MPATAATWRPIAVRWQPHDLSVRRRHARVSLSCRPDAGSPTCQAGVTGLSCHCDSIFVANTLALVRVASRRRARERDLSKSSEPEFPGRWWKVGECRISCDAEMAIDKHNVGPDGKHPNVIWWGIGPSMKAFRLTWLSRQPLPRRC
jgi:hypothetical protein